VVTLPRPSTAGPGLAKSARFSQERLLPKQVLVLLEHVEVCGDRAEVILGCAGLQGG